MTKKKKNIKQNNIFQLLLGIIIIILINIISSYVFKRIDLTSENRYSLSDATKTMLNDLDDYVYFRVYLEGDFPAGFKRLRNATREMLDEFSAYSDYIDYEFINPSETDDPKERRNTYQLLMERGLQPTDLQVKTNEGMSTKIIFPGAIATYKSSEVPVELLNSQMGVPPEAVLNNSIQALEFKLANAINKLTKTRKPKIAFIKGHGELSVQETADIMNTLSNDYTVERISLDGQLNSLAERLPRDSAETMITNKYDALVIAKPVKPFRKEDKYIIDQFIMRGGKVLWLVDPVFASMDSIKDQESTMGITMDINIDDQLFNYGVRLNTNLLMDLTALPIPLHVGQMGDQPQIDFFPWYYFPLITPMSDHPVVKNLNAIKTQFISSIDTISVPYVKKTILLKTSPYTRVVNTPAYITLRILRETPDEEKFSGPPEPVAILLEGNFESVFKNRIPPEIANNKDIGYLEKSKPTKMIVVSDGDIIKNQIHISQGYPLPLGYDQFTGRTYGNKEFIINALNYLVDESGLISIRSREIKLRLLDKTKISGNKLLIQIINIILPILIILIFGIISNWLRKRKYKRNWSSE